jgi:hypothetical protein
VPLSPILGLFLLLRLHTVLYAFDRTGSLSAKVTNSVLVRFLNWFVNAPIWFRTTLAFCCVAAMLSLFVYLAPLRGAS